MKGYGNLFKGTHPITLERGFNFLGLGSEFLNIIHQFTNIPSVKVRGVETDMTPTAINSLFWSEQIVDGDKFTTRVATKQSQCNRYLVLLW